MDRRAIAGACATFVCVCLLVAVPVAAAKEAGVVSELEGVRPATDGLELQVAGGDRFLVLTNGTGKEIVVKGYDDEPYLRFLPNRRVEVNTRSPSKYANEDRYALQPVPAQADSNAPPRWQAVSQNGSYRWFDHRIHLMEKGKPPQVKDEDKRTKIFDWSVPMTVGGATTQAVGTLAWVPASSSDTAPLLFIGIGVLVLLVAGAVYLLLRRRRGAPAAPPSGAKPPKEAW